MRGTIPPEVIVNAGLNVCKGNANRVQSSLLGIAEVQLALCKDTKISAIHGIVT